MGQVILLILVMAYLFIACIAYASLKDDSYARAMKIGVVWQTTRKEKVIELLYCLGWLPLTVIYYVGQARLKLKHII